ncbi:MAG: tol-pal system protein YbgF [Thiotrichales bacterium]|nr:tol-pal system protein YbgF [Thiotrichales bacterium]
MNLRPTATFLAMVVGLLPCAGSLAQAPVVDARELDERLKRLERLFDSGALFKMVDEMDSLAAEVRELRGQNEALSHRIEQMEERQRQLYLDADQRLQRIESAAPAQTADAPPSSPPSTPPATPTTPAPPAAAPSQPPPATPPIARASDATGVDPFAEQQAYQSAFNLLKSGSYDEAAVAFQRFISEFPAGSYADNAQYWLGETFYITRRFKEAVQEFERLVSAHPASQKLTHALLKIGYAHDELGNLKEAERVLTELIERHPQSAAAGLARKRLTSIRQ